MDMFFIMTMQKSNFVVGELFMTYQPQLSFYCGWFQHIQQDTNVSCCYFMQNEDLLCLVAINIIATRNLHVHALS